MKTNKNTTFTSFSERHLCVCGTGGKSYIPSFLVPQSRHVPFHWHTFKTFCDDLCYPFQSNKSNKINAKSKATRVAPKSLMGVQVLGISTKRMIPSHEVKKQNILSNSQPDFLNLRRKLGRKLNSHPIHPISCESSQRAHSDQTSAAAL